jgi:glutamyl-tRNA synthetase
VVVRFKMPAEDVTVHDEVMGDVTVAASELDDFIIRKADGMAVYHLANVVDDGLMGVNLVMRGQEFLGQTPRHIALQRALAFPTPRYAHLPLIMDLQGRKLSKRDGDVEVHSFRAAGYLPEALLNFIALLGWSPGGDREKMTKAEMVELFSIERIGRTNAKFDREKLVAFNTDWSAALDEDRQLRAYEDYLSVSDSVVGKANLSEQAKRDLLRVNRGYRTFADIDHKCGFLYVADEAIQYDPAAVKKVLEQGGFDMLGSLLPTLEGHEPWTAESLEKLLQEICAAQGVGMGKVAQPIRVAVSGGTISPAIYETLVLLGKARTLSRVRRALGLRE